eukprot:7713068-Prorocentrum_lima.AAC.1
MSRLVVSRSDVAAMLSQHHFSSIGTRRCRRLLAVDASLVEVQVLTEVLLPHPHRSGLVKRICP